LGLSFGEVSTLDRRLPLPGRQTSSPKIAGSGSGERPQRAILKRRSPTADWLSQQTSPSPASHEIWTCSDMSLGGKAKAGIGGQRLGPEGAQENGRLGRLPKVLTS
jgi:hypothetical protein